MMTSHTIEDLVRRVSARMTYDFKDFFFLIGTIEYEWISARIEKEKYDIYL